MSHDFIEVFPGVLDPATCKSLIETFRTSPDSYGSGVVTGEGTEIQDPIRKSTNLTLNPGNCEHLPKLAEAVRNAFIQYREKYETFRRISRIQPESFSVVEYQDNSEYYTWHIDGQWIPGSSLAEVGLRVMSAVFYLNTVREGGETEFRYQERKIVPTEGSLLLFPSGWTHEHRGLPPLSGKKYIVTNWLRIPAA